MALDYTLVIVAALIKAFTLFLISGFLLKRWLRQDKLYMTDFPFLVAMTFIFYAIGKFIDVYAYTRFQDTPNPLNYTGNDALMVMRVRFFVSPVLVVLPYFILMMVLWLEGRPKIQLVLGSIWGVASISAILLAKTFAQMLLINSLVALIPILFSIISYVIIHVQKRLPGINSLILAIGWTGFVITQLIRPMWYQIGSSTWGLAWVGELVELFALLVIAAGFLRPAFYYNKSPNKAAQKPVSRIIQQYFQSPPQPHPVPVTRKDPALESIVLATTEHEN